MPNGTRVSVPDGDSIGIAAPCLLDDRFWQIDGTMIKSVFSVQGLTRVIIYTGQKRELQLFAPMMNEVTHGNYGSHLLPEKLRRDRFPIRSVVLGTALGFIELTLAQSKLEIRLSPEDRYAKAVFTQWDKNFDGRNKSPEDSVLRRGEQAIEYHDTAVLIDRVWVNDLLVFQRTAAQCRVDLYFHPEPDDALRECPGYESAA